MKRSIESWLEKIIIDDLTKNSMLSSSREWKPFPSRVDDNLFFSLIAFQILKDSELTVLIALLKTSIEKHLDRFRNKYGRCTYNFWPTKPNTQWPNSNLKSRLKHFWIPDDLDCTALSYEFQSKQEFLKLREHISEFSCFALQRQPESELNFYSTWFGNKMKPEFDICASINYLLVLRFKEIKPNAIEKDMIQKIKQVIHPFENENSFILSPNYQRPEVILWHIARLLKAYQTEFKKEREKVISYIANKLESTSDLGSKLWLRFALIELGEKVNFQLEDAQLKHFVDQNEFFYAPMLYAMPILPTSIRTSKRANIVFVSKSFNATVLLNYLRS